MARSAERFPVRVRRVTGIAACPVRGQRGAMQAPATADMTYGIIYGVHRTTIYLPEELKERLTQEARRRGVTEAQVIREALAAALARPRPRGGLLACGDIVARRDELMEGFGES